MYLCIYSDTLINYCELVLGLTHDGAYTHTLTHTHTHTLHTTGGLGQLLVVDKFEVWVCVSHTCSTQGDRMCFTYSEVDQVFVPWGLKSTLELK